MSADGDVRGEFAPLPGQARRGVVLIVVGVCGLAGLAVVASTVSGFWVALFVFGPVAVLLAIGGVAVLWAWLPRYRLAFTDQGIDLIQRRRHLVIPWTDVGAWWIGIPPTFWGRQGKTYALLVQPSHDRPHPEDVPWRMMWLADHGMWQICELRHVDADADQVAAAIRAHLPDREGAPADQGTVGDGVRGEFRRRSGLAADAIGVGLLGVLATAAAVWTAISAATGVGRALAVLIFGSLGLLAFVGAWGSYRIWRSRPYVNVDATGVTVGDVGRTSRVDWHDVVSWHQEVNSRWGGFPSRLFLPSAKRRRVLIVDRADRTLPLGRPGSLDGSADEIAHAVRAAAPATVRER